LLAGSLLDEKGEWWWTRNSRALAPSNNQTPTNPKKGQRSAKKVTGSEGGTAATLLN
jgi:hypothetical protein